MASQPISGRTLGHYRLIERVGEGGMGVVYRAYDEHLQREIAVKLLPASVVRDESARRRYIFAPPWGRSVLRDCRKAFKDLAAGRGDRSLPSDDERPSSVGQHHFVDIPAFLIAAGHE